jgi:serine/threonine protein kinase
MKNTVKRRSILSSLLQLPVMIAMGPGTPFSAVAAAAAQGGIPNEAAETTSTIMEVAQQPKKVVSPPAPLVAVDNNNEDDDDDMTWVDKNEQFLRSLVYQRKLGKGSYKTVYHVSSTPTTATPSAASATFTSSSSFSTTTQTFDDGKRSTPYNLALAVEPFTTKSNAKAALRGVEIAQELHERLLVHPSTTTTTLAAVSSSNCGTLLEENHHHHHHHHHHPPDTDLFEQVYTWWFQSSRWSEFQINQFVFPPTSTSIDITSHSIPSQHDLTLRAPQYLLSLKPLYDLDLYRYMQQHTEFVYPIQQEEEPEPQSNPKLFNDDNKSKSRLTAMELVLDLCHAGQIMHQAGLIHRDIKPKNIMLWTQPQPTITTTATSTSTSASSPTTAASGARSNRPRPVIIDFGFAKFVNHKKGNDDSTKSGRTATTGATTTNSSTSSSSPPRICIVEPGRIRGELSYVLAKDVAQYQGCTQGDCYAMGKTIYEVLFRSVSDLAASQAQPSQRQTITAEQALIENDTFRSLLLEHPLPTKSRLAMTNWQRDVIMETIGGLTRAENPWSFTQAELYLQQEQAQQRQQQQQQRSMSSHLDRRAEL